MEQEIGSKEWLDKKLHKKVVDDDSDFEDDELDAKDALKKDLENL